MMRGVSTWAVAVRLPSARGRPRRTSLGEIEVKSTRSSPGPRSTACCRWPIIRGVVALVESLGIGFKALGISANAQVPDEEEPISGGMWVGTIVVALAFAIGLFFVVPVGLTSLIKDALGSVVPVLARRGRSSARRSSSATCCCSRG